ncbi:hypothetical protein ACJIZ3_015898 [Penstemon smallii]|uniref:F-box domain-containing protein n=1 Tax=Penstemon smallii TaxID=265156 RepID=A0ABD3RNX6_9LAMI
MAKRVKPSKTQTQMAKKMKPSKILPFDLINDNILPKFPVKSLVRFTSVCKTWESLIKSPEFIATHFKLNNRPGPEVQYPLILNGKSCYTLKNQIPINFDKLGSMSHCSLYDDYPAESCNGLILLKVQKDYGEIEIEYLLWNPTIKKSKTIESFYPRDNFHDSSSSESGYIVRGLGFHESSNDYKVVKIEYDCDLYYSMPRDEKISTKVEIYSLKTESWRKVDSNPNGLIAFRGGVFLNGCVHWLATRKYCSDEYEGCTPEGSIESILFFDFEKECFGEIKLPQDFDYGDARLVAFKEFQGSLAAVFFYCNDSKCFVWVMGEYGVTNSWNKKMTISLPKKCGSPLGFTKNGMLVCEEYNQEDRHWGLLMSTSTKRKTQSLKTRKKVPGLIFLDVEKFKESVNVIDYMESLALLGKDSSDNEDSNEDEYYGCSAF